MPDFAALAIPHPAWQPAQASRPWSPFSATYTQTLTLLAREADQLRARSVLVQVVTAAGNTRGGNLRSDARVDHPGVIVTLDTAKGSLVYETDAYRGSGGSPAWHANLRAVALGLEALRKVERYGIARGGQQYAGFRAIGSGPIEIGAAPMDPEHAARVLADADPRPYVEGEWRELLREPAAVQAAYREAVKVHHPDAGGDPDAFKLINEARRVLEGSR